MYHVIRLCCLATCLIKVSSSSKASYKYHSLGSDEEDPFDGHELNQFLYLADDNRAKLTNT